MTIPVWSSVSLTATGKKLKQIVDRFPGNHGDYYITSSNRPHTPNSHHGGRLNYGGSRTSAIDIGFNYGSSGYQDRARELAKWLYQWSGDTVELISTIGSGGYYVKNQSRTGGYAVETHRDHIHFATSDALANRLLSKIPKLDSTPPPQRDDLDMADLLWFTSNKTQKLKKNEVTVVEWQGGNHKNVSASNPFVTFLFQEKNFTGHVRGRVVGFDEDGNFASPQYRVQMGKVTDDKTGVNEPPNPLFTGAVFTTSEFALPMDEVTRKGERLRLYVTALTDGVEWREGKVAGWQW